MKNFVFEVLDDLRAHDHRLVRAETEEEARARCEAGDEDGCWAAEGDVGGPPLRFEILGCQILSDDELPETTEDMLEARLARTLEKMIDCAAGFGVTLTSEQADQLYRVMWARTEPEDDA